MVGWSQTACRWQNEEEEEAQPPTRRLSDVFYRLASQFNMAARCRRRRRRRRRVCGSRICYGTAYKRL